MTPVLHRSPFDVWAPRAERVRLSVGDATVAMTRGDDDWWIARRPRARPGRRSTTATCSTTPTRPDPTRGRGVSRPASTSARAPSTPRRFAWTDQALDRPAARRRGDLRAARRHLHPGGHLRRRARPARPPARPRRRPRRADAGQRVQRHPQLGLRRRALVRRPRAVRRPGRLPALRRRLPRGRPRRDPGRRLQPPRPVGELPAASSGPTSRRARNTWGDLVNLDGEGSAEVRRYILDNARMWLARLPRRRAAARRRARARRRLRRAPARGAGDRGGRAVGAPRPAADADRRVRPQRPGAGHAARGRRLRARRAVERRLPPRGARRADRRDAAATTPTSSRCRRAGQGVRARVLPRRHLLVVPRPRPRRRRSTPRRCRPGGWWCAARTTTRSATAPSATGSPTRSTTTSSPAPRC